MTVDGEEIVKVDVIFTLLIILNVSCQDARRRRVRRRRKRNTIRW